MMICFVEGKFAFLCFWKSANARQEPPTRLFTTKQPRTKKTNFSSARTTEELEFLPCPFSGGADQVSPPEIPLAQFAADLSTALDPNSGYRALSPWAQSVKQASVMFGLGTAPLLSQLESRDGVES